jgi:hypothetical protein
MTKLFQRSYLLTFLQLPITICKSLKGILLYHMSLFTIFYALYVLQARFWWNMIKWCICIVIKNGTLLFFIEVNAHGSSWRRTGEVVSQRKDLVFRNSHFVGSVCPSTCWGLMFRSWTTYAYDVLQPTEWRGCLRLRSTRSNSCSPFRTAFHEFMGLCLHTVTVTQALGIGLLAYPM